MMDELEREKQEITTLPHHYSHRWIPPMAETPQLHYVSKVLFPKRIDKDHHDQKLRVLKQTINVEISKQSVQNCNLSHAQSTKNLILGPEQRRSLISQPTAI